MRAVTILHPPFVVIENVAALRWRGGGLDIVLAELHRAGYDCVWTSLRASDVGAPHRRERVFLLGWPRRGVGRLAITRSNATPIPAPPTLAARPACSVRALTPAPTIFNTDVAWGPYEPAIRRWETVLGRPAPCPVEPGRSGRPRLAAPFVEWLMGLGSGHVCDLELPRTAQLRILGNGVVPQQAAHAARLLLAEASSSPRRHDTATTAVAA
jgi:DNA (cytosine-5)-methyltransferase 1